MVFIAGEGSVVVVVSWIVLCIYGGVAIILYLAVAVYTPTVFINISHNYDY